jgi:hypothetical protein
MEYSSSSSSSSSSDDDEATFAALTSTVNVFTRAAQFVLDRIDAEEAECMELDALDDSSSSDDEDESTWGGSPVIFLDIDGVRLLNDRQGSSSSRIYELIHMLVTSLSLIYSLYSGFEQNQPCHSYSS